MHPATTQFPTTFHERGTAVPFTAPGLWGARIRPSVRDGFELVLPNMAGGRGSYVLAPAGVSASCRPTVHDLVLLKQLATLHSITPATVRLASLQVAADGLAGRPAAAAARAALEAGKQAVLVTNFELLRRLVAAMDGATPDTGSPAALQARAKRAVAQLASRMRRNPAELAAALEDMATLLAPVGLGAAGQPARLPASQAALVAFGDSLAESGQPIGPGGGALLGVVLRTARLTAACAATALQAARTRAEDVVGLLAGWFAAEDTARQALSLPDWLLDGWDRATLVWQGSGSDEANRALAEIGAMLPTLPQEAGDLLGVDVAMEIPFGLSGLAGYEAISGAATPHDAIARNERLCAVAA